MNRFNQLPEFRKDLKKLKKYSSLQSDLSTLEQILKVSPTGIGKSFTIIHCLKEVKLIKVRLACKSLRKRSMRVIYAYHINAKTFEYIEIYFKGNKQNEDQNRIKEYLNKYKK